jgi:hypothetical protein
MGSWSATATPATVLREAFIMYVRPLHRFRAVDRAAARVLHRRLLAATRPITAALSAGPLADLVRSKPELIADNALLRQHLIILRRWVKRPHCTTIDRTLLVLVAGWLRTWRQTLLMVQPDTLLRGHRDPVPTLLGPVLLRLSSAAIWQTV